MSAYSTVLEYVRVRTGLLFPASRLDNAEAGVETAMAMLAIDSADGYLERIRADDRAFEDLIAQLTVGETYFCRYAEQFAALRSHILPDIAARHGAGHPIRVWSAGCASGEEAYSLTIILLEERLRSRILATDISPAALAKARAATYGMWSLRGTQPEFRQRYFRPLGDRFVLDDEVRRRVRFDALNLASNTYPSRAAGTADLDLILCRNVLIYFDAETIREVGRRLMLALAPGGWLLLGASDPLLDCIDGVQRVSLAAGAAYQRNARSDAIVAPARMPLIERAVEVEPITEAAVVPSVSAQVSSDSADSTEPTLEAAIQELRRAADAGRSPGVLELAADLLDHFPLSADLHFLHALLLLDLGSNDAAETALRRTLFLDRSLAAAHFALGALLRRRGDEAAAARSFGNAVMASEQARDASAALGDGMSSDEIRMAAQRALRGTMAEDP